MKRDRRWRIAAWLFLVFGTIASAAAGFGWFSYQESQNQDAFQSRASILEAVLNTTIQRNLDFQRSFGQFIATTNQPTNHALGPWLKSIDISKSYPNTVGFTFIEPLTASQLPAYEAAVTADPIPGAGPGPYQPFPATSRARYCLSRFGFILSAVGQPTGIDVCAGSYPGIGTTVIPQIVERAAQTGTVQFADAASIVGGKMPAASRATYADLYIVVMPIYRGGARPATEQARTQSFLGWVLGDFNGPAIITPTVASTPNTSVQLMTSDGSVFAEGGPKAHHGWFTASRKLSAGPGLVMVASSPDTPQPEIEGLLLGLLGLGITSLLFAFAFHLGRSREGALQLVAERTEDLRHQALHDALTGLPNRALLFDRAEQMLARARRHPRSIGALFLDLDNFKDVNDSLGHNCGDELLKAVAARLKAAVRDSDTVGRLGGDEFLVLTEDEASGAGAEMVAERIIAVLSEPFELHTPEPVSLAVKASVGLATGLRENSEDLIRDADVALYQAKEAGKGRYVTFRPEMQEAIQDRLTLEMDLRHALDNDELFVLYQPIFDLAAMTTKGVEALVRWQHPTRGVIPPADFIPIAEQSGLIIDIGAFVLREACRQAAEWHRSGYPIGMSVNVSAIQLETETFVGTVRDALAEFELDPAALTLEITETVLMRDTAATAHLLRSLKDLGVRIAIDDFGTGYSSMAYLRQFPIDSLKIDRTFIAKASQSPESVALVHTLVQLGKALQMETLAEGIEEPAQLSKLQNECCDSGQGFLYARPLSADEIVPYLSELRNSPQLIAPSRP